MGKLNEIQQETTQSWGDNSFTTKITNDTVEFDSAKDSFTFKDKVNVPSLDINGQATQPFTSEEKTKLSQVTTPMNIKGRIDSASELPTEDVQIGDVYLVGPSGSENFEEYVCTEISGSPEQPVWENLGHVKTQSDWNQNNSNADDFIKNRTHYIEEDGRAYSSEDSDKQAVYLPDEDPEETSPSFWCYPDANINMDVLNSFEGRHITIQYSSDPEEDTLEGVVGESVFEIQKRDEETNNIYAIHSSDSDMDIAFIALADNQTISYVDGVTFNKGVYIWYYGTAEYDDETGKITELIPYPYTISPSLAYHQLDEKFIPNTIARISDIPSQQQTDWKQTTSTEVDFIKNKPAIKTGDGSNSIMESDAIAAYGANSHAEGSGTMTTSNASGAHAEGLNTSASAQAAHAEGNNTQASGANSHAEGLGTMAYGPNSSVFGMYNMPDIVEDWSAGTYYPVGAKVIYQWSVYKCTTANGDETFNYAKWAYYGQKWNYAEIAGGGDSSNRTNIRTLDWEGNEQLAGTLRIGSTSTGGAILKFDSGALKVSFDNGTTWRTVTLS